MDTNIQTDDLNVVDCPDATIEQFVYRNGTHGTYRMTIHASKGDIVLQRLMSWPIALLPKKVEFCRTEYALKRALICNGKLSGYIPGMFTENDPNNPGQIRRMFRIVEDHELQAAYDGSQM